VAGGGRPADKLGDNGSALAAFLNEPRRVAVDASGNLFIVDTFNLRIRRVDANTGIITTVAGDGGYGPQGDGGLATRAGLQAAGVLAAPNGDLFIADYTRVRRVDGVTGVITTVAGGGEPADKVGDGGLATAAALVSPVGLALDAAGNLYVSDYDQNRVRRVD